RNGGVACAWQNRITGPSVSSRDRSLQRNRLFEIGVIILAVGATVALIGGYGEVSYIQCLPSGGSGCVTDTQYTTDLFRNPEMVSVGLSIVLVGAIIMIGGSIT